MSNSTDQPTTPAAVMTFKRDPIWPRYTSNDGCYFISRWEGRAWRAHYRDADGTHPVFVGKLNDAKDACRKDARKREEVTP